MSRMKFGVCPCCRSRNLKKIQGEQFTCLDCAAPLRFTWNWLHWASIIAYILLSNYLDEVPVTIRFSILAVVLVVLLILYFRLRQFHLDEFKLDEELTAAKSELYQIDRFVGGKIGVIDFINEVDELKKTYAKEPAVRSLVQNHFNRVGGLSIEEQALSFTSIHPYVDLKKIALQQQHETRKRIERLNAYKLQI
ncbi:hypothetical protein [Cellvibrio sp. UBA7671]|uniref:hypothetical protein n=1 Tax=Cellvibrio sp. UBA7671 TaxID=1946312 RepID=UPI002F359FE9